MRAAAIDVGTNSVLLTVAEIKPSGKLSALCQAQKITRLGKDTHTTKRLLPERIRKTVQTVKNFQRIAQKLEAEKLWLVGTSALREARNRADFVKRLKSETGLKIEIISGKKEAELGLLGALSDLRLSKLKFTLIDIGGGSTEITLSVNSKILSSTSLNFGAVRLTEQFFPKNAVSQPGLQTLLAFLSYNWQRFKRWKFANSDLVGTGGTVTTLAALDLNLKKYQSKKVHGHLLKLTTLERFLQKLSRLNLSQRKKYLKIDPGRADIIVAGAAILLSFMHHFGFEKITISDKGLRWGLLYSKLNSKLNLT
jgi:exopolyphosphatase/guanosine-5'-triphosphate,3'-diphosphate pyrophosphatase